MTTEPTPEPAPETHESMAEANIFAMNPAGFKVHIKLPSKPGSIVRNVDVLLKALAAQGYGPDTSMGKQQPPAASTTAPGPVSEVWTQAQVPATQQAAAWMVNQDGSRSCSVHGVGKFVPPGTSRQGKPYLGFWACSVQDCKPIGANR